jgi:acetylglutamate kinase
MLDSNNIVIKYGGSLLEDPGHRRGFLQQVAQLSKKAKVILVHGGGKEITRALEQKGIPAQFVKGLRVTNDATMDVVEEVLSRVNREIVRELEGFGVRVEGHSGKDDRVLLAEPIPGLGRVGKPVRVDLAVFGRMISRPPVPVFYSVATDSMGRSLNINADDFALALAIACTAKRLVFLTDTGALLDKAQHPIPQINLSGIDRLLSDGTITGGMIIKIKACAEAMQKGVGTVDICKNIDALISAQPERLDGTSIVHNDQPTVEQR